MCYGLIIAIGVSNFLGHPMKKRKNTAILFAGAAWYPAKQSGGGTSNRLKVRLPQDCELILGYQ